MQKPGDILYCKYNNNTDVRRCDIVISNDNAWIVVDALCGVVCLHDIIVQHKRVSFKKLKSGKLHFVPAHTITMLKPCTVVNWSKFNPTIDFNKVNSGIASKVITLAKQDDKFKSCYYELMAMLRNARGNQTLHDVLLRSVTLLDDELVAKYYLQNQN
jgi:hypothetical protein